MLVNLLVAACENGDKTTVDKLISGGICVDTVDDDGRTALMAFCDNNQSIEIAKILLLNNHADINIQDCHGRTALMISSISGHYEMVQTLLTCSKHAIKVDLTDNFGYSAVTLACLSGNIDIVKLLVHHRASIGKSNPVNGLSCFTLACAHHVGGEIENYLLRRRSIEITKTRLLPIFILYIFLFFSFYLQQ